MASRSITIWCWAILVVLAGVAVCAPRWIAWLSRHYRTTTTLSIEVPLASLLPDRGICEQVTDDGIAPTRQGLVLRAGRREIGLSTPGDLRGHVRIDTPAEALDYVRLGSSKDLAYAWQGCGGLEIVRGSEGNNESGKMGVVTPRAWRIGKFTPPTVKHAGGDFVVERWLMLRGSGLEGRPVKVREHVGRDGSYRQEVLPTPPLPPLPDTRWGVYGRK